MPFGKRVVTGYCVRIDESPAEGLELSKIKTVLDVIDKIPLFSSADFQFYKWMADYYLCSLGEVLRLASPFGSDVQSSRKIIIDRNECSRLLSLEKKQLSLRYQVLTFLLNKDVHSFSSIRKQFKKSGIYSLLRQLHIAGAITILDEVEKPKIKEKSEIWLRIEMPEEEVYEYLPEIERKSPRQLEVMLYMLKLKGGSVAMKDVLKELKVNQGAINALVKKSLLVSFSKRVERSYKESYVDELQKYQLTEAQDSVKNAVQNAIQEGVFKVFLLHGVTGSGKTLVYIELAKKVIELGKKILVLVPEISLTPQITSRFIKELHNSVAVIHSKIAAGERFDSWEKIRSGSINVVIGARSALFAPLDNIGLIVVDEEHDASYKQSDPAPRYNARDSAIMKAKLCGCPVILGSATPSVESMQNALSGKYSLLELKSRVDDAQLPVINLVNVVIERKQKKMENIFSRIMLEKIDERLKKKEGVIVLQNRRGFSTQVYCFECGHIETCVNCSVSMIHHINKNILECHYCGYTKPVPNECTQCGSHAIKFFGAGTEKVEDELSFYFPTAVMGRIDSDALTKKGYLSSVLNRFRTGEIDILVGTQMVAKGLDFSRVTLVCVVSAETNLWLPDFRADERTFQLLTQVAGRAGRNTVKGEVLIQTQNDSHPILKSVVAYDYDAFYKREIFNRKRLNYPPFTKMCIVESRNKDEKKALNALSDFYRRLLRYKNFLKVSPPSTAIIARLREEYRFIIIVRSLREVDIAGNHLRNAIKTEYGAYQKNSEYRDVRLIFDMDPQSIM